MADLVVCAICGHDHAYSDEPCVSCGCDAVWLNQAAKDETWVRRLVRSWLRDPEFVALMEALGDD